jgi:hypothetical protein
MPLAEKISGTKFHQENRSLTNEVSRPTDFYRSDSGAFHGQWRAKGRLKDALFDARLALEWRRLGRTMQTFPARTVLISGVEIPERKNELLAVFERMSSSRHHVTTRAVPCAPGKGKFQNLNEGLRGLDLEQFDWMVLVDDDVELPNDFLDKFLYLSEAADLHICMPAHRFRSNQTFQLTARHWGGMVRITQYVESGPITAFRRSMYRHILPFPELKWAWGTNIGWGESALKMGYRIGIVDGTPIRHVRPVGKSYDVRLATEEAEAFLAAEGIVRPRREILSTVKTLSGADILTEMRGRHAA